jgi:hypothetical protein
MADINVTEEIIDINVTEEVITIEAPTGAYPFPNAVFSVFGRVGAIVAAEGDYNLTQLGDVTLTSPANGQVLKYNGTQWVNSTDADTGITTLNTLTALSQSFATGTSGTDFNISSATSTHTFNLPTASETNRGLLSSTDWTTFNNKQNALTNPITGTGTSGQVAYFNGTSSITSNAAFAFTPTSQLLVNNSVTAASAIARGTNLTPTLTAAANFDVLVGLDINPTFTNGAFTGVTNYALRSQGRVFINPTIATTNSLLRITDNTNGTSWMGFSSVVATGFFIGTNGSVTIGQGVSGDNAAPTGSQINIRATTGSRMVLNTNSANEGIQFSDGSNATIRMNFPSANEAAITTVTTHNLSIGTAASTTAAVTNTMKFFGSSNNVGINQTTDAGFRLDVNGTTRLQGSVTIPSSIGAGQILFSGVGSVLSGNGNLSWYGYTSSSAIGLYVTPTLTAQSNLARGTLIYPTLTAAANNDVLVGLDINPTFTNGAFTGVSNLGLRVNGITQIRGDNNTISSSLLTTDYLVVSSNTSTGLNIIGSGDVSTVRPVFKGTKSRGTVTSPTAVVSGDDALSFLSAPYDGSTPQGTAGLFFQIDGAVSSGVVPQRISFLTSTTNGSSRTEKLRISANGNVLIQNGGTFTDAGFRLDVNGTARVQDLVHLSNASGGQIRMWTSTANNSGIYGINSSSTGIYGNAHVQFDLFVRSTGSGTKKFGQSSLGNTNNICITNNNTSLEPIMITTTDSGAVGIMKSTSTIPASAVFEIESTTKGFLPPRMTTTQKNAIATPAAGLMVFDTTLVKLCVYNGTTWETITSI